MPHRVATVLLLFTLSGPVKASTYLVRRTACKSLGALAKFSTQYTEKALDLLMDMMNDDTEAVRLQALEALFRMSTYGCLSVHEKHMHMVLTMNILRSQMHDW
ncbi:Protein SIEL [Zea mays]|nr:Protein SIEL [Zea mays]ONM12883.1 Protein SIEL [Zea mays]ONM12884.1 Protein SIEL [Zea mays]